MDSKEYKKGADKWVGNVYYKAGQNSVSEVKVSAITPDLSVNENHFIYLNGDDSGSDTCSFVKEIDTYGNPVFTTKRKAYENLIDKQERKLRTSEKEYNDAKKKLELFNANFFEEVLNND